MFTTRIIEAECSYLGLLLKDDETFVVAITEAASIVGCKGQLNILKRLHENEVFSEDAYKINYAGIKQGRVALEILEEEQEEKGIHGSDEWVEV